MASGTLSASAMMPAAFIGHGTPMNAIGRNRFTDAWRRFGEAVPKPRAVLVVSAHWYVDATLVTAMAQPRTIHDFYGFPQALYSARYPAPGLPSLAEEIADMAKPLRVATDLEWGLDHGSWAVLAHVFPDASVPVVEMSVNASEGFEYHFELGRRLAPLRERGVVVIGSGQVVNDQRNANRSLDTGYDWANDYDARVRDILLSHPSEIWQVVQHPHFRRATPSPDHFWPLVQFAGLADATHETAAVLEEGVIGGSISMTCFTVGLRSQRPHHVEDAKSR